MDAHYRELEKSAFHEKVSFLPWLKGLLGCVDGDGDGDWDGDGDGDGNRTVTGL